MDICISSHTHQYLHSYKNKLNNQCQVTDTEGASIWHTLDWMMEDLLRVLFLLCAIAAPGHSLSCLTCAVKDSTCKGTSMTCPTGSSCGLVYRETTEDEITTKDYIKSCVPSNNCTKVGSISYSGGQMKMGISCCKTDNCTPRLPKLPADSTEGNGVTCPTCRSTTSNSCDSQSYIDCTGNEQMCINQNTTSRIQASRLMSSVFEDRAMGCATQSICDIKDFFYENGGTKIAMKFICNSGSNSDGTSDADIPVSDNPLSCYQCVKYGGTCKGDKVTCPAGHSCGLSYREITEDGKVYKEYIKSCVPTKNCTKVGHITHAHGIMKMGISCCDTDYCTPPIPQWPSDSSEANGLSCPTCRSYTDRQCDANSVIACTGNEQTCARQVVLSSDFNESAVGCATQSICDPRWFSYIQKPVFIVMETGCNAEIGSRTEIHSNKDTPRSCVVCTSEDSLDCNGELVQCPLNHVCASAYRVILSGGAPMFGVARSCLPKNKCDASGTMSLSKERLIMGTSCCDEDGCTPSIKPPKNPVNTKPNGVKCNTCISSTSDSCEATNTMECSGDENQCVNYAIIVSSESQSTSFSMRGCGAPALCKMRSYSYTIKNLKIENRFTCTKG